MDDLSVQATLAQERIQAIEARRPGLLRECFIGDAEFKENNRLQAELVDLRKLIQGATLALLEFQAECDHGQRLVVNAAEQVNSDPRVGNRHH